MEYFTNSYYVHSSILSKSNQVYTKKWANQIYDAALKMKLTNEVHLKWYTHFPQHKH